MLLSECCDRPARFGIHDSLGICDRCGEWSGFYEDDYEKTTADEYNEELLKEDE